MKPRLLDLFCGGGSVTRGYQNTGFYVVGVDIVDQPHYCGDEFYRADALDVLRAPELREAIPPVYTELIGHQLMQHLKAVAA